MSGRKRDLYLIIPAAGSGTRMGAGSNKLFIELDNKTVFERTLDAFVKASEELSLKLHAVVVTNDVNLTRIEKLAESVSSYSFIEAVIEGGATRPESVKNGVDRLSSLNCPPAPDDPVLIHDGARCFVTSDIIASCLRGLSVNDVCVTGVPCKNTIKVIRRGKSSGEKAEVTDALSDGVFVEKTPDRSLLYEVQTPQCFRYHALIDSYGRVGKDIDPAQITDDVSLAELCGYDVAVVDGSYSNIKITTPEDLLFAGAILHAGEQCGHKTKG